MSLHSIAEKNGRRALRLVNPATLAEIGELPVHSAAEVAEAVARARAAQPAWARTPVRERCRLLARAKELLVERIDQMATTIHQETGKPRREAVYVDLATALDAADLYVRFAPRMLAPHRIKMRPRWSFVDSQIEYQPFGVVAVVSPWNYPLGIPLPEVFPALAAGNACVVKPSEHTPLTMLQAQKIFLDAGLPAGLLEVVVGDGAVGAALLQASVDRVVFTGSVATGRKVAALCAERFIPVTLELGGSDPMIVRADADPALAAQGALWGRFVNSGQTCCAVKRLFVHQEVAGPFLEELVSRTAKLKVGIDTSHEVDMGPLISDPQRAALESQLADAVSRGAKVETGGARPALPGFFFQPTILTGAPADARVFTEETFGPLLPVVVVKDDEEALARANDTRMGLTASVWSKDVQRARELAARIEAGTVIVNNNLYTFGVSETPWGGFKESGLGRTHGAEGLLDMCRAKHVNVDRWLPKRKPWWFPHGLGAEGYQTMREAVVGLYGGGVGELVKGAVGMVKEKRRNR